MIEIYKTASLKSIKLLTTLLFFGLKEKKENM